MKPIVFSEASMIWIQANQEAIPGCLWADFYKIAVHNDKCREILGVIPKELNITTGGHEPSVYHKSVD